MTSLQTTTRRAAKSRRNFKAAFKALTRRFTEKPESAVSHFEVASRQIAGLRSEVEARDFMITVDEPEGLGGENLGPNPVELILAAAASCQEITYRLYADQLGIPLDGVAVTARGDIDLKGLFSVDPSVRSGFRGIELEVELDSPASQEQLDRLKRTVDTVCPALDIIRNATPVLTRTERRRDDDSGAGFGTDTFEQTPVFAGLAG